MTTEPHWRTPEIVALCRGMRETGDYSACPQLADMLESLGYGDFLGALVGAAEDVPAKLRGPLGRWEADRLVSAVYSDETAEAVRWMDGFAVRVGYTFAQVVTAGHDYLNTGDYYTDHENWDATNAMCDLTTNSTYWDKFALVTGRARPSPADGSHMYVDPAPFTCPC